MATIPEPYPGECQVIINDKDFDIVARNILLLLIALHSEPKEAATIVLHIWCSALVPSKMVDSLQENIATLIKGVCGKIENKDDDSLHGKTWKYGIRSLRVVLKKIAVESSPSLL
jgi:hypothetical protein